MDDQTTFNIDFNQKFSNEYIVVKTVIIHKFFYATTFTSRSREPITIKNIEGPQFYYKVDNLKLDNIISVTFIYPKGDENPFILCIERSGKKIYYELTDRNSHKWSLINELNNVEEHLKDKMLLDVIKKSFSRYFQTILTISENQLIYLVAHYLNVRYNITVKENRFSLYDRYHFKPNMTHSLSAILIDGEEIKFDKELSYVKDVYIYYFYTDKTTPLMVETLDYEIGDKPPLYNYYVSKFVNGLDWKSIDCSSNLVEPKCKSDIERALDEVLRKFKYTPLPIDIERRIFNFYRQRTVKFGRAPFEVFSETGIYYGYYSYSPILTKSFYISRILLSDVEQNIDVQSKEYKAIYIYNRVLKESKPVLLCFELYIPYDENIKKFLWYYKKDLTSTSWFLLDFDGNPREDFKEIEDKIRDLYESYFKINLNINPYPLLPIFSLGALIGSLIGLIKPGILRSLMIRLNNIIRT